jgi:hypothetical protein
MLHFADCLPEKAISSRFLLLPIMKPRNRSFQMADEPSRSGTAARRKKEDSKAWLVGGGEMGKLIRSMDWSMTPLGPIESWPQSLRTTVSLCLSSNFPIALAWGPKHIQIYNDGYWPICGKNNLPRWAKTSPNAGPRPGP